MTKSKQQEKQLPLRWSDRDLVEQAWRGADGDDGGLALLQEFVHEMTLKEAAHVLDERESTLTHGLREYEGREPQARLVYYAAIRQKSRRVLRHLCALAGCDCVERTTLTPEEENRRLRASLAKTGPAGAAILEDALGPRP